MKDSKENSGEELKKEELESKPVEGSTVEPVVEDSEPTPAEVEEPTAEAKEIVNEDEPESLPEEESVEENANMENKEEVTVSEEPKEEVAQEEVKAEATVEEIKEEAVTEEIKEEAVAEEIKEETVTEDNAPVENTAVTTEEPAETPVAESPQTEVENKKPETTEQPETGNEEQETTEEQEEVIIDYSGYTKEQLVEVIEELTKEQNISRSSRILKEIQPLFDDIVSHEREDALHKFVEEGGNEDDFEYKHGELDNRFDASLRLLKDRKYNFQKNQEQTKQENLELKNQLLEELRNFVDSEETNTSINALKELQQRWKDIGMVPHTYVKTLWANYNALIDRFYDNRSIYFELKELDRRKNLELKEELCQKAEALESEESLNDAIAQLNELHHEYKHIGPIPMESQESMWQRFKAASDKVYARRKTYIDQVKKELSVNLDAKKQVIDEVKAFVGFNSDRINEWNAKTKEIIALQKKWESIGGLPRDKAKEINKEFWSNFKSFFSSKNAFFKTLEGQREENLEKKEALVAKAEELKDSENWDQTAQELKKLQTEWKEIGPVPQKKREDVYARFKAACDHFFDNRRAQSKNRDSDYLENYKQKEAICKELDKMAKAKSADENRLSELIDHWNEIGFVPKKSVREIQDKFFGAIDQFLTNSGLDDEIQEKWRITAKFSNLKGKPNSNSRLNSKENTIRKQISQLESDISLWKNNLEFFAASKTAEKLKHDFDQKIEKAQDQLNHLKDELKIIRQM